MHPLAAQYYDAIYSWKDYAAEADRLRDLLRQRGITGGRLLDVACGTGRHLELLSNHFDLTGIELDPAMLAIARARLPEVRLVEGDMREFDLGETFDVVTCLFSAIGYMTDLEPLHAALSSMAKHLRPEGWLVLEPWFHPHEFTAGHVGGDYYAEDNLKIARIGKSWTEGPVSIIELHHLVGTPGRVESFIDTLRMGLFTDTEYRAALGAAGLRPVEHDAEGLMGRGLYLARKPS